MRDLRIPGNAVGQDEGRVVGAHAPVDADGIETAVDRLPEYRFQGLAADRGIGHDKGQHRRHVRLDHPRPFGDAAQGDFLSPDHPFPAGDLGKPVRRHDPGLGIRNPVGMEPGNEFLHPGFDLPQGKAVTDDTGGGHKDQFIGNSEFSGSSPRNGQGVCETFRPGRGVGNTAVGDNRLGESRSGSAPCRGGPAPP